MNKTTQSISSVSTDFGTLKETYMSYETDLLDAMYDLDMIVRVYARKRWYADELSVVLYSSAYVQSCIARVMADHSDQKESIAHIKLSIQDILSRIDALECN